MAVVDIHCHNFNADDVPIRGFVRHVALHDLPFTDDLGRFVDLVVQGAAIGFEAENAKLDTLLTRGLSPQAAAEAVPPGPALTLDDEADLLLARLDTLDPGLVRRVGTLAATGAAPSPAAAQPEGLVDWYRAAHRLARWAALFAKDRLDITVALVANFGGGIDLFTPLLVDLEPGLGDVAPTSLRQQVVLQEKISRLSMLGLLPGPHQTHVHPFVGFDPRRELAARRAGHIETPLDLLETAVTRYGVIGVKVYPPMGFKAIGNAGKVADGAAIDGILRDLYRWCQTEAVPITAHTNPSNYAHEDFKDFASPTCWAGALKEFPELRVDLGHFGGAHDKPITTSGWPWKAARLMDTYPNVYADVGNHKIYDAKVRATYLGLLESIFAKHPAVVDKVMFGSDWYMLAAMPEADRFLATYRKAYQQAFGAAKTRRFLGANALRFLGFDDAQNPNNQRVRARYERHAPANLPAWLA